MTKRDFISHFYEIVKNDIVGVIDETLRFYDTHEIPILFGENVGFSFKLRLETCSYYVCRPTFSNLCFMVYTIMHYMSLFPLSSFDSKKVSPNALLLINLFYELVYVDKKNNSK